LPTFGRGREGDAGFGAESFLATDEMAPLMLRGFPKFGLRIAGSYPIA